MTGRLVGLLAVILAALFSTPLPAASAAPAAVVVGYTYDGPLVSVPAMGAVSERGPPATTYDSTAIRSVADTSSHGSPARPARGSIWTYTDYDYFVRFVRSDCGSGTTTTARHAVAFHGARSLAERTGVAAKTGARFGA